MKCFFCNSDDLKITHTDSKNESVTVSQFVTKPINNGIAEMVQKPIKISATRRKVKCKACGRCFWTVEHFESSTKRTDIQQTICSNMLIGDIATEMPNSDLSYDDKELLREQLTKLIQEDM